MKRFVSAQEIHFLLLADQFKPRTLIFNDSDYGKVECIVYNVAAPTSDGDVPFIRFEATPRDNKGMLLFQTLTEALNYIGIW
jgi:hypothetical protein